MTKLSGYPIVATSLLASVLNFSTAGARALDPLNEREIAARAAELQNIASSGKPSETDDGMLGACHRIKTTLDVVAPDGRLLKKQDYFLVTPESSQPSPVVVVVPTMRGFSKVETRVAEQFCNNATAVLVADVNDNTVPQGFPNWGMEDERNRYSILALRAAIDYASISPHFLPGKVGIFGASMGGILTSFIAGLEAKRLAGTFIVVGGGNLPFVLANSDEGKVSKIKKARMSAERIGSQEAYEEKLHQVLRYDPIFFASLAKTDKIYMVMSSVDTKVPAEAQTELHNAFKAPAHSVYELSHGLTIGNIVYLQFGMVLDFFRDRFK